MARISASGKLCSSRSSRVVNGGAATGVREEELRMSLQTVRELDELTE